MSDVTGRMTADFPLWSPEQMFTLAADIERYPDFIPWCKSARVVSRQDTVWQVENHFGAGPVDATFRTIARPDPPRSLEITATQAPFRHFRLEWRFAPLPGGGCRVVASYALALRSPILHGLARLAMPEATRKVILRFKERAATLYGGDTSRML